MQDPTNPHETRCLGCVSFPAGQTFILPALSFPTPGGEGCPEGVPAPEGTMSCPFWAGGRQEQPSFGLGWCGDGHISPSPSLPLLFSTPDLGIGSGPALLVHGTPRGVALMGDGWDRSCKLGPGRDKHPANTTSSQYTDWLLQPQLVQLVPRLPPAPQPPFFCL